MNGKIFIITLLIIHFSLPSFAQTKVDSTAIEIDEVVVTGTRYETDIRHLPMSISVVNKEQISGRYEQSLLPILTEQVPSFFATSRGILGYGVAAGSAGGMKIRGVGGSPTAGLLVLIDGHPQYMGLMGHPLPDAYQSMIAEKVEVLRGPASVLYGSNAMGGVINIVTPKQKKDEINTNVRVAYGSYNTLTTDAINSLRKGKFSSIVTASYNRTDGHRADLDFKQYGGYTKLGYDFTNNWKAFADLNITHFDASNPGTVDTPILDNDARVTRGMTSMSIENNYNKTSGALKLFYNWGRHKINDGYQKGETPQNFLFNSKDLMLGITWYQSISLFEGNRITAGVDYQHFGGEAWNKFVDNTRTEIADKTENEVAGYVSIRQAIGEKLTLDAGVRVDHHSKTGTEWIPQGGLTLQLTHSSELRGIVSKGFRNPTIREMYMFPPKNDKLMSERMMNYEISYSQRLLNNSLSYSANIFYIDGDNMIETLMIDGRPLNVNTGKIKNWGTEFSTQYRINSIWNLSANYSWLHMKYKQQAAPEHKLYVGGDFNKNKWRFSTGVQYISGLYTSSKLNAKENFVLWNLRGTYHLCSKIDLFVRGENLLAQRYEINAGYPMPKVTAMGGINIKL